MTIDGARAVWLRALMAERYRARWGWQFFDNPNNGDDGPVIWVAIEDQRVLGQMATMPAPFRDWVTATVIPAPSSSS